MSALIHLASEDITTSCASTTLYLRPRWVHPNLCYNMYSDSSFGRFFFQIQVLYAPQTACCWPTRIAERTDRHPTPLLPFSTEDPTPPRRTPAGEPAPPTTLRPYPPPAAPCSLSLPLSLAKQGTLASASSQRPLARSGARPEK